MSKAFLKDDAPAAPEVVPSRPPLPDGVTNYVTPQGLDALERELAELVEERARLERAAGESDERVRLRELAERRAELEDRIASAVVVAPRGEPSDVVRFGADVTVRAEDGRERRYRIVGVDEADAGRGKIAFTAPLARALLGHRAGESVSVRTPRGEEELEIVGVAYAAV